MDDFRLRDGVVMGCTQAMALGSGVSRSGGTMSAGLFIGLTREVATQYSLLLAIPAVVASGPFSLPDVFESSGSGPVPTPLQLVIATAIAFSVGYMCIAWLLRWAASHNVYLFVWRRLDLGTLVMVLLAAGTLLAA